MLTPSEMIFTQTYYNNTFSLCSSPSLPITTIPISLYITGSNYESYQFSPSNVITLNIVNNVVNTTPTLALTMHNQQKSFLDVNFTNNVAGVIYYQIIIGQSMTPLSLQNLQVYIKSGTWVLASQNDFLSKIYTSDRDNRIQQFFQSASTTTIRISNLIAESAYTLCAYIVNVFGTASSITCSNLFTMNWGTVMKASLSFNQTLTAQQLNNVICYFTAVVGTSQLYLVDG
jgi:hypothetical protein